MANRTKRTYKKTEKFLVRLARTGNIALACRAEGIGRTTAYEWREADEAFRLAWDVALEEAADLLEKEANRRAVAGIRKAKLYKGKIVHWEKEYSDSLLIVLLKAARPAKFRERFEHTGADGVALIPPTINVMLEKVYGGSSDDE